MRHVVLATSVAVLVGCPVTSDPLCERNVCVATDAGLDATPIDPCVDTPAAAECLDDAHAIFVSASSGDDQGGDGTRARPFRTVAHAMDRVEPARKRVYVCEGRYAEDLLLTGKHDGASIIGGFDCAWNPTGAEAVIGSSANPVVINGARGLALASIAIEASDNQDGSSIAVRIVASNVRLKRARLAAGAAGPGQPGALTPFTYPAAAMLDGKPGTGTTGGAETSFSACPGQNGVATVGGRGGDSGQAGQPGQPDHPGTGGEGGAVIACASGGDGAAGEAGPNGTDGPGASRHGDFQDGVWQAEAGGDGTIGKVGQGGGGGAGINGFGGGGGGAGGCGGAPGSGGAGGGSSIALASVFSLVKVEECTLATKAGGRGGDGAAGQSGQPGGGPGGGAGNACDGAGGGKGGDGGAGGGGAGGVSVGVLYKGMPPEITLTQTSRGSAGTGGTGPKGNNGIDGVSVDVLELK